MQVSKEQGRNVRHNGSQAMKGPHGDGIIFAEALLVFRGGGQLVKRRTNIILTEDTD
jgi:hypothetical protein